MTLKPVIKKSAVKSTSTTKKGGNTKKKKELPSDAYKPLFEPVRFLAREVPSRTNPSNVVKQYIEVSVKRFDAPDEELGLPYVMVQMYQESATYTGYLSGKTVYMPLEMLYDFMDALNEIDAKCEELKIE